jgi:cell division protease FtsH
MNRLCVLLGGRVAEELVFGEITTGATDDLNKATAFVRRMIMEFGMNEKLGTVAYKKESGQVFLGKDIVEGQGYSDSTAELIDSEVKRILSDTYAKVHGILEKNRELLEAIATRLIEKEVVEGEELDSILQGATA